MLDGITYSSEKKGCELIINPRNLAWFHWFRALLNWNVHKIYLQTGLEFYMWIAVLLIIWLIQ